MTLKEWLKDSMDSMELVLDMLPVGNEGHTEARGRLRAYQDVLNYIEKQEPETSANDSSQ